VSTTSTCTAVETGTPALKVTVAEPPPAGTAMVPEAAVAPLLAVAYSVAPPQPDGMLLTVTLVTDVPVRFCSSGMPTLVHRGVAIVLAPIREVLTAVEAAAPMVTPAPSANASTGTVRHMLVSERAGPWPGATDLL